MKPRRSSGLLDRRHAERDCSGTIVRACGSLLLGSLLIWAAEIMHAAEWRMHLGGSNLEYIATFQKARASGTFKQFDNSRHGLGPGVPDPPRAAELIPKSQTRHRLAAGALVLVKSVLGGLHHEYSSVADVSRWKFPVARVTCTAR